MFSTFRKKRYFALSGSQDISVFGEVMKSADGSPVFSLLARTEAALTSKVAAPRLLSTLSNLPGEVSCALPLYFFEIVSVPLPMMPDGAVNKALPYHLAKAVNKPLTEYIYDWQITERRKEKLQITVYLFPASTYQNLRKEFSRKQLEIKHLEADVFAAFAYLAGENRLSPDETTVCALVWPKSISLAVYEKQLLTLARTVNVRQPALPTTGGAAKPARANNRAGGPGPGKENPAPVPDGNEKNLAGVAILSGNNDAVFPRPGQTVGPSETGPSWDDYIQRINLEIMRTQDYYASVLKGGTIRRAVIGGAESFWDDFQRLGRTALGLEMEPLTRPRAGQACPPLLQAVCLGTGARW